MKNLKVPNLIIPGAPKAGTSSLHYYLNQHPDINMSTSKEPHIYSRDDRYKRRFDKDFDMSFLNIFDWDNIYKYRGESSTAYWVNEKVPERIFNDNHDCKIIILLRDPVDRVISHYNWVFTFGVINKNFKKEIEDWIGVKYDESNSWGGGYKYYDLYSRYGTLIERYLQFFSKDQLFLVEFEKMKKNILESVNEIYSFLELEKVNYVESLTINKTKEGKEKRPFDSMVARITKIISDEVKRKIKFREKYNRVFKPSIIPPPMPSVGDIEWLRELFSEEVTKLNQLTGFTPKYWRNYKF